MLAVGLSVDEVTIHIEALAITSELGVACVNSPNNTTVSGNTQAIDTLADRLTALEVFNRKLSQCGLPFGLYEAGF